MNAPVHVGDMTTAITPAMEKRFARELSPAIAWPTLVLALALLTATVACVWLGLTHAVPAWLCAIALTILSFAHYTLVHESIHDNLVPGYPKLRRLNTVVGWIGALGRATDWPTLMRGHTRHHSHTNTADDPDIFVKGTFAQLMVKFLIYVPMSLLPLPLLRYAEPRQYKKLCTMLSPAERAQAMAVSFGVLGLLAAAVYFGRVWDWVFLLFVPTRLAALFLAILFSWLPHHPFDRTERYLNTRISLWPGAAFLTLQQNLHLVHHLWPSVPFYNYGRLYRRLRPLLIAKGSRIEGLRVGSSVRDRAHA